MMQRDNWNFMEKASIDARVLRIAYEILGVDETADEKQLKKAYRRIAMRFHPDKNTNDPNSHKKFILAKCVYDFLAHGKPCPQLLEEINSWPGVPEDEKYKLDNTWGHFLWWREKFFDTEEKNKKNNNNRSSCI